MSKGIGRRGFLKVAATAATAAAVASSFPAPAISQGRMQWRMVTTWPRNYPALGTGANLLADFISRGSDGRLTVKVYGAGEIVPAFEAMDAVTGGTAEMGHGAPYYWKGKVPASQYVASIPFGLTAQELNAWFQYGGGQEIADKIYGELGTKFFPSGNSGVQMGGWFNKEMNSIEDYKGLKMRIPGLGGEVIKAAGANVVNLSGGQISSSLLSGAIDATEWVGPYNDLAFGLYKSAKYYYYPGWHEPGTVLDCFINRAKWDALPSDLQAIVEAANTAVNQLVLSEFVARNSAALDDLINKRGVQLRRFSDDILRKLGALSAEVLADLTSKDPLSAEVYKSLTDFRKQAIGWSKISEQTFLAARALSFQSAG